MDTGLWSHPAHGSAGVEGEIAVTLDRPSATTLRLRYLVRGCIERIVVPPPAPPLRADNLWKTTCFEAFLAPEGLESYLELNFSPSSQWAAYDFASYRAGMVQAELPAPPQIEVEQSVDRLALTVTASLHLPHERYRLGLAAVIEGFGGSKAYFAVSHAGRMPDFHRRHCFVLELPPPERA